VNEAHRPSDAPPASLGEAVSAVERRAGPQPPAVIDVKTLSPAQWGIIAFLGSEVAFFSTLIVTYINFLGADNLPAGLGGPTPAILSLGLVIVTTACLLSSSLTIHLSEKALERGAEAGFRLWWVVTIVLGVAFLLGTAYEWRGLITEHGLTIRRNLFGTTYYTLVGFHAFHVTAGVITMLIVFGLALVRQVTERNAQAVELVSWYWHFVDGVWIVVFAVVYLVGR
jgi:cytochrome c oxidase subunit 3